MKRYVRRLPRILSGPVWAVLLALLWGCPAEQETKERPPRAREMRPDQEIEQFVLEETVQGKLQWILRAKWAAIYEEEELVRLTGVNLDFLDEEGNVSSTLTSDKGLLQRVTSSMEADGRVTIVTRDSVVLKTDQLFYVGEQNLIRTESFVEITKGSDIVTGYGLESDPQLKHFEIKRRVKGHIRSEAEEL